MAASPRQPARNRTFETLAASGLALSMAAAGATRFTATSRPASGWLAALFLLLGVLVCAGLLASSTVRFETDRICVLRLWGWIGLDWKLVERAFIDGSGIFRVEAAGRRLTVNSRAFRDPQELLACAAAGLELAATAAGRPPPRERWGVVTASWAEEAPTDAIRASRMGLFGWVVTATALILAPLLGYGGVIGALRTHGGDVARGRLALTAVVAALGLLVAIRALLVRVDSGGVRVLGLRGLRHIAWRDVDRIEVVGVSVRLHVGGARCSLIMLTFADAPALIRFMRACAERAHASRAG